MTKTRTNTTARQEHLRRARGAVISKYLLVGIPLWSVLFLIVALAGGGGFVAIYLGITALVVVGIYQDLRAADETAQALMDSPDAPEVSATARVIHDLIRARR
mgnify:CR=1 FL=1